MKAILISIKPKWVAKILNGEKIIEIRKTMSKCDLPIDVYIYCTKDKKYANLINRGGFLTGMVVAKFTLNKVEEYINGINCKRLEQGNHLDFEKDKVCENACVIEDDLYAYAEDLHFYAWHIDGLEIFYKPIELNKFRRYCDKHFDIWKKHCLDCKAYTVDSDIEDWCDKRKLTLSKPPQSYCFVEKIEIHHNKEWF